MKKGFSAFVFTLLLLASASTLQASSVTYTFTGTGTGDLNGVAFTSTPFTITVVGDTSNIVSCFTVVLCNPATSATIAISGFPLATFITATQVFDSPGFPALGFERAVNSADLLDLSDPAFATYDLATSIGPIFVATPFAVNQFNCGFGCVVTNQGNVDFSSIVNVTFTASTVPEPATLGLLGLGCSGLAALRRLRRKA